MYVSPSTGDEVTAAQLLAEIMCVRKYAKKGINLPLKFWNLPEYKKEYRQQIISANSVLKVYEAPAILAALKTKDGAWQWSLRENKLLDVIEKQQNLLNKEKDKINVAKEVETSEATEFRKVETGKQSLRSKLD